MKISNYSHNSFDFRCRTLLAIKKIDEWWLDPVTGKVIIRKGQQKKPIGLLKDLDEVSNAKEEDTDAKKPKL